MFPSIQYVFAMWLSAKVQYNTLFICLGISPFFTPQLLPKANFNPQFQNRVYLIPQLSIWANFYPKTGSDGFRVTCGFVLLFAN